MTTDRQTPPPQVIVTEARSSPDYKVPRAARFAEATTVLSPIEPRETPNPFADPPTDRCVPQTQLSDVGFGYVRDQRPAVEMEDPDNNYLPPPTPHGGLKSPLKSALKSPGAAPKKCEAILSPTFQEEEVLEKAEYDTEKVQAIDLKAKTRVRMAKFILRGVNFSCSLIVLSMLATTFSIFNATKLLPPRNNLPAWAPNQSTWPQIVLLVIACVSLLMCIVIFYGYFRGGHRRAEKVAVYYTTFAVAFFVFSIVMWGVGAAMLNQSKNNGNGQDMWGWSCKDNTRRALFQNDVSYALVCRLQNWSLICCIIEIVVEVFTIAIYGIVFWRFYSKRKLRKTMQRRDTARSDLYLAQLRSQSVPNTPGGPLSPRDGGWRPPLGHNISHSHPETIEYNGQYTPIQRAFSEPKPFQLGPAPTRVKNATRFTPSGATENTTPLPPLPPHSPAFPVERIQEAVPRADGERDYGSVSIPGGYQPVSSPGFPPGAHGFDFDLHGQR